MFTFITKMFIELLTSIVIVMPLTIQNVYHQIVSDA